MKFSGGYALHAVCLWVSEDWAADLKKYEALVASRSSLGSYC